MKTQRRRGGFYENQVRLLSATEKKRERRVKKGMQVNTLTRRKLSNQEWDHTLPKTKWKRKWQKSEVQVVPFSLGTILNWLFKSMADRILTWRSFFKVNLRSIFMQKNPTENIVMRRPHQSPRKTDHFGPAKLGQKFLCENRQYFTCVSNQW